VGSARFDVVSGKIQCPEAQALRAPCRDAVEAETDGAGANWQLLDFGGRLRSFAEQETMMKGVAIGCSRPQPWRLSPCAKRKGGAMTNGASRPDPKSPILELAKQEGVADDA
jgi:hypothetical protein